MRSMPAASCRGLSTMTIWMVQQLGPATTPALPTSVSAAGFTTGTTSGTAGIVANPNCCTIQMVMVLKPLHDAAGIERIEVATYQSVSGAGREALEELARQSIAALSGRGVVVEPDAGTGQIAFNCVPHID